MTDNQRQFLHDALTSILRAEEDPNIENLSKEDIWEETKSMTLESPPEHVEPRSTGEILRSPMDISKEMELIKRACPEGWAKRIRDLLMETGPIRTTEQISFCHERCKVLCSKPELCPFTEDR